jgi:hypothetical protein
METPKTFSEGNIKDHVKFIIPPEELNPGDGFNKTLGAYREWINYNRDRVDLSFQNTASQIKDEDDPLWEIRQQIRRNRQKAPAAGHADSLKWHLILSLAKELELDREEADRALNELRSLESPLTGSIEKPDSGPGLFNDLPGFKWTPEAMQADPAPIIAAWLGLFGSKITPNDLLLTLERHYLDHLADRWIEAAGNDPPVITFTIPDLSNYSLDRLLEIRQSFLTEGMVNELKGIFEDLSADPGVDARTLSERGQEVFRNIPQELSSNTMTLTAIHLSPLSKTLTNACVAPPPPGLLGRTLLSVGE